MHPIYVALMFCFLTLSSQREVGSDSPPSLPYREAEMEVQSSFLHREVEMQAQPFLPYGDKEVENRTTESHEDSNNVIFDGVDHEDQAPSVSVRGKEGEAEEEREREVEGVGEGGWTTGGKVQIAGLRRKVRR